MRYILAPAVGSAADDAVIPTALIVARTFAAHVRFLHVRLDASLVPIAADALVAETTQRLQRLESDETGAEVRARANVERACIAAGIPFAGPISTRGASADFATESGPDTGWMAEYGRFADLIVVGRRGRDEVSALSVVETSLLESGRPLLLAARDGQFRIGAAAVIAWSDTPYAMRAVHAAQPFLAQAERIVIACVDAGPQQKASAEHLAAALALRNATVAIELLRSDAGDPVPTLTRYATEHAAGLLVMGGYSHSPVREFLFGGATISVLNDAPLPVLMSH